MTPRGGKFIDTAKLRRWRGVILEMVWQNHHDQGTRYDYSSLWAMMREFGHDIGLNTVLTLLQDLKDSGHLTFREKKNDWTNDVEISEIEITRAGRNVVEKITKDDAIQIL